MVLGAAKLYIFTLPLFGQDILRLGSSYCTLNRLLFCMRTLSAVCVCVREIVYTYVIYMCAANQVLNYCAFCTSASHYMCYACVLLPPRPILNLYVSRKNRSNARLSSLNQSPNSWRAEKYLNLNPRL